MERDLSQHAEVRCRQRAVPPIVVHWLRDYGAERPDGHGAIIRFFDKAARRRLARAMGRAAIGQMSRFLNAYLVEADGSVVTIGRRIRRLPRR